MRKMDFAGNKAQSLRGYKRHILAVRRSRIKRRIRQVKFDFLDVVRKHSYAKGEPFYFGSKRYNLENKAKQPPIPQIAHLLFKKPHSFTTNRVFWSQDGKVVIPKHFSLTKHPKESFGLLKNLLHFLYKGHFGKVIIDYSQCEEIDLDASVCMDIIVMEFYSYLGHCAKNRFNPICRGIRPTNYMKPAVLQVLTAIGAFRNLTGLKIKYDNMICLPLAIIDKRKEHDSGVNITQMVDYVEECLVKMHKELTVDAKKKLCDVIGEILINAEEHSTTDYCFSIGYFHDFIDEGRHTGIFNLVIFNYGDTIYEKFKSPNCQENIVARMKSLSQLYVKKNLFGTADFQEETLWTLYALQEGITSVPKDRYLKRGNGSITFIESFFELKGSGTEMDDISRLTIMSGNTKIIFDGKYKVVSVNKAGSNFKVMAFNDEGDIEMKPDKKNVTFVENYFPGTLISAKIQINDNDVQNTRL